MTYRYIALTALLLAAPAGAQVRVQPPQLKQRVEPGVGPFKSEGPNVQPKLSFHLTQKVNPEFGPKGRLAGNPPRPEFYQGDPADSVYRAAHAFFNRQEYRQAADRFSNVRSRFANSRYFCDAAYYEAFARYRLGTLTDLRTAHRVLEAATSRCSNRERREDVPELQARINGALARNGDADAADRVRRAASEGQNVCDREERNVKIEAMAALAQMDPEAANPILRRVLATKDVCSAPVRRQAIAMVARRNDVEAVSLLGQIARNDPDRETQLEAVRTLGRMSTDAAYAALEEFFRSSNDERMQAEVARSLATSDNPRAQSAVRALIERRDVAERTRIAVINALASRPNLTLDYWRSLYGRLESDDLRSAVIFAIARIQTEEAQLFLLNIARNQNESYESRQAAISRIGSNAPINELYRLVETADSRPVRMSIVRSLAARKEPDATDRLIDIAKSSTDPEVRNSAIRALRQPPRLNDPKVVKALEEILCCL
jgi:HEAT repeat protein